MLYLSSIFSLGWSFDFYRVLNQIRAALLSKYTNLVAYKFLQCPVQRAGRPPPASPSQTTPVKEKPRPPSGGNLEQPTQFGESP